MLREEFHPLGLRDFREAFLAGQADVPVRLRPEHDPRLDEVFARHGEGAPRGRHLDLVGCLPAQNAFYDGVRHGAFSASAGPGITKSLRTLFLMSGSFTARPL